MTEFAKRVSDLEARLQSQEDRFEIHDVLCRYSRALDWGDASMLDTVFYDDAVIDYGFFKGNGKNFKAYIMDFEHGLGRRWHMASEAQIELAGDTADAESYSVAIAAGPFAPAEGPECSEFMLFFGIYKDRLLKRGGKWGLIERKHIQNSSTRLRDQMMAGVLENLNQIGVASPRHPDYRRLSSAQALDEPPVRQD